MTDGGAKERIRAIMIAVIDYDMGNLRSVQKAFAAVGADATVTRAPRLIDEATHVVLPGVGAFRDCMANLERYELIEPIRRSIRRGKPFLGICLGLQLLFTESEEFGLHKGLDVVRGRVRRFVSGADGGSARIKIPHMGWNQLTVQQAVAPLEGLPTGTAMYFVHSYYVEPDDPASVCTVTDYGRPFVSSICRDNVLGCQFHPEKSQQAGLRLIKNFASWRP